MGSPKQFHITEHMQKKKGWYNCIQTGIKTDAWQVNTIEIPHVGNQYQEYSDTRKALRERNPDKFSG